MASQRRSVAVPVVRKRRAAIAELESRVQVRTRDLSRIEARLAEAQQLAHVGSWEWNVADNCEWWSDELYRICGYEPGSFSPTHDTFRNALPLDEREMVGDIIRRAFDDHQPFEFEHRFIRPNGTIRTLHCRGRAMTDESGHVVGMVGAAQDITDQKAAQKIVKRSERRLQTIINAEPACVKLVSHDGLLLDMNRAGLDVIGAETFAHIAGRAVIEFVHPADRERYHEMHVAVSNGTPQRQEFRIVGFNGVERWVDSHSVPFDVSVNAAHTPSAVLSVTTDVTERKRLEDQLRLGHKMEAIGLLAGGVAHDFNNLLTSMGGYTELVLDTFDANDPRRGDLTEVQKAVKRAAELTRQLLAFGRRQVLQTRVLDMNALVADVHKLLRRTIPEHITLTLDLDAVLEPVRADPGQLEQVVLNLALNAADAMPEGGQLRFTTSVVDVDARFAKRRSPMTPGRYIQLLVRDTGQGMSLETQARIFEPFFTTKAQGKGTGLGLATVYGIVKQSGGFIWVTSEEGKGTTFEIYFPAVNEAIEQPSSAAPQTPLVGGTETIVLAEDDGGVRRFAGQLLRRYGYTVLEARDGDEAISTAHEHASDIHLLVTDLVMPGLSGRCLAVRLRAMRPNIRVLYSSGYSEHITQPAGAEEALPLLPKPYPPAALLRKVREILDNR